MHEYEILVHNLEVGLHLQIKICFIITFLIGQLVNLFLTSGPGPAGGP